MIIFQKNFNNDGKSFDPIAHYASQQKGGKKSQEEIGKEVMAHLRSEVEKDKASKRAMSTPESNDQAKGDAPREEVKTPKMGESGYNWRESGVTGKNSVLTQSTIKARQEAAGLDENGDPKHTLPFDKKEANDKNPFTFISNQAKKQSEVADKKPERTPVKPYDSAAARERFRSQNPLLTSDQVEELVENEKRGYDQEVIAGSLSKQNVSTSPVTQDKSKTVKEKVSEEKINPVPVKVEQPVGVTAPEPIKFNEDGEVITEETEALPELSLGSKAKVKATLLKDKVKNTASDLKDKTVETYNNLSEKYGEGLTGSLGKDAALAAGGLALAGGAYHILKKRRAKKKAEQEALDEKIKK